MTCLFLTSTICQADSSAIQLCIFNMIIAELERFIKLKEFIESEEFVEFKEFIEFKEFKDSEKNV